MPDAPPRPSTCPCRLSCSGNREGCCCCCMPTSICSMKATEDLISSTTDLNHPGTSAVSTSPATAPSADSTLMAPAVLSLAAAGMPTVAAVGGLCLCACRSAWLCSSTSACATCCCTSCSVSLRDLQPSDSATSDLESQPSTLVASPVASRCCCWRAAMRAEWAAGRLALGCSGWGGVLAAAGLGLG
ncbi:hypothetical protein V8C86DRAFT_2510920 [Haematococcus lacustris]